MRCNKKNLLHYPIPISVLLEQFVEVVVSIATMVEATDSAVRGGVVEVVSSNPARVINIL